MITIGELEKCEYYTVHIHYIGGRPYFTVKLYYKDTIREVAVNDDIDFVNMVINKRHKLFGLFFH